MCFSHIFPCGPVWRQVSRATPTVVASADPSGPGFRWTKCAPSLSPSMMATNPWENVAPYTVYLPTKLGDF